jgi:hypothetical protein
VQRAQILLPEAVFRGFFGVVVDLAHRRSAGETEVSGRKRFGLLLAAVSVDPKEEEMSCAVQKYLFMKRGVSKSRRCAPLPILLFFFFFFFPENNKNRREVIRGT